MAYLEPEVIQRVEEQIEQLRIKDAIYHAENKAKIKALALEQAILKRSMKKYSLILWAIKNKEEFS